MGKLIYDIQEYSFSKKNTNHYHLRIAVDSHRLTYIIFDKQDNLLALKSHHFDIKGKDSERLVKELDDFKQGDALLDSAFHSIRIGLTTPQVTLVPDRLYMPSSKRTYLEKLAPIPVETSVLQDTILPFESHYIYGLPGLMTDWLSQNFPFGHVYHLSSGYLLQLEKLAVFNPGPRIYINVFDRFFFLALLENKSLLFSNHFTFRTSKDFLYYVMLVFDQFKISPEKSPVYLSGQIMKDAEIYNLLFRYVKELKMLPFPEFFKKGKMWEGLPDHLFYDLLCLKLCE